jgi:flagellar basal-body rod modification protein FlgD
MAVDAATIATTPTSAPATTTGSSSKSNSSGTSGATLADNFPDPSCTLLTTQLQNQNPLDPLDTNQFTSATRAVRSGRTTAEIRTEQLDRTDQSGADGVNRHAGARCSSVSTVAVDGSDCGISMAIGDLESQRTIEGLEGDDHHRQFGRAKPLYSLVTTPSARGQHPAFVWDGKGNDGTQWPAGDYKMTGDGEGLQRQGNSVAILDGGAGHRGRRWT